MLLVQRVDYMSLCARFGQRGQPWPSYLLNKGIRSINSFDSERERERVRKGKGSLRVTA